MIFLPVYFEGREYGFITIFFEGKLEKLLYEDRILLQVLSNKAAIAIKFSKLLGDLLSTFQLKNFKTSKDLKKITELAIEKLEVDLAILFIYNSDTGQFEDKPIISGVLNESRYLETAKDGGELPKFVIDHGPVFCRNKDEYIEIFGEKDFVENREIFKQIFWDREDVQSMAAIPLKNRKKTIGVIFFNYKDEQSFTKAYKDLIVGYTAIATPAIIQTNLFKNIGEEMKQKTDEIFGLAKRTSFYLKSRAINHDIRSNLIRIAHTGNKLKRTIFKKLSNKDKTEFNTLMEIINHNSNRIEGLLDNFSDPDYFEDEKYEQIDVREIIDSNLNYFEFKNKRDAKGTDRLIKFQDKIIGSLPELTGDSSAFTMVIYNVISNSVKAIEKKGNNDGVVTIENFSTEKKLQNSYNR